MARLEDTTPTRGATGQGEEQEEEMGEDEIRITVFAYNKPVKARRKGTRSPIYCHNSLI